MENKKIKLAYKWLAVIVLILTMIYAMAIDSLSIFNILLYGAALAWLWYLVKVLKNKADKEN